MKYTILILAILLTACGGSDNKDPEWVKDWDLCIDLGGTPKTVIIEDVETGKSWMDVECNFKPRSCPQPICKPGAECHLVECD